ncbi:coiled-coil domain-containing protein 97-like isoform X2 [Mya arenaria]|nr:coiled-coil domain-containing protein 97-like isoform X2 [Mya arenaria]XP_052768789.1 coiled-coil domain-containing protein 97-like isoform X2 [Mya arenaria]
MEESPDQRASECPNNRFTIQDSEGTGDVCDNSAVEKIDIGDACSETKMITDEDSSVLEDKQCPSETSSGAVSTDSSVRVNMLARVALSNAHFKHQQIGEPDLTLDEKIDIAQTILDASKVKFLSKFWSYLELEDLEFFNDSKSVYEVDFYIKQILKSKNSEVQRNRVKNRRYEAMKELISQGDYFSDDEMKFREPYLYEQMVGQYLTGDEIQAKVDKSDLTFSNILLKHIDQLDENVRYAKEKDTENGQMEEEEDSEEEEDDQGDDQKDGGKGISESEDITENEDFFQIDEDSKPKIPDVEKQALKAEFLTIMQERFLSGADITFDYSAVDNNEAYDDLSILNADAEEKYFEDEDPESIHSDSNL